MHTHSIWLTTRTTPQRSGLSSSVSPISPPLVVLTDPQVDVAPLLQAGDIERVVVEDADHAPVDVAVEQAVHHPVAGGSRVVGEPRRSHLGVLADLRLPRV